MIAEELTIEQSSKNIKIQYIILPMASREKYPTSITFLKIAPKLFYFEEEGQKVPHVISYNNKLEVNFKSVDRDNEIYKYVLKEFGEYPRSSLGGECFAAAIAYLDSQKLREKGVSFTNEDFKNYALAEYIVQYFQYKAFETSELQRIRSKIRSFTGDDSIVQFFIQEERNHKYSEKSLSDEFSRENVPTEIITELKEKNNHLTEELENQKNQSENEKENLLTQVQELSQKITETREELIQAKTELETTKIQEADKIKKLQQKLNHQLS
nr:5733_t:CDS:2 [Entrophospora candida]